jgi:hypothetical protein
VTRVAAGLLVLAAFASAQDALRETRREWSGLDRPGKIDALLRLGMQPSAAVLKQCGAWLEDKDPLVRAQVVRLVAHCIAFQDLRPAGERMLAAYLKSHLALRARLEKAEFERVCREHGRAPPADDEMTAGRDWEDPYDEKRRPLPVEIKEERAHMREVIAAIEEARAPSLRPLLLRVFEEHHDPEVVVRTVRCFAAWNEWQALAPMADLWRIQRYGRELGGRDVIGRERYEDMRLRWDVHKDRLWWSRPEYVPRVSRPIAEAASAITGASLETCRELDAWLLSHGETLREHGVKLSKAFLRRARTSQG